MMKRQRVRALRQGQLTSLRSRLRPPNWVREFVHVLPPPWPHSVEDLRGRTAVGQKLLWVLAGACVAVLIAWATSVSSTARHGMVFSRGLKASRALAENSTSSAVRVGLLQGKQEPRCSLASRQDL